ncbi:MAG: NRDE family protein [Phycisphaerales bacterium]
MPAVCTLTIIPVAGGLSAMINRDELVGRAAAIPPRPVVRGTARLCMPLDPHSGGTWVGLASAGYMLALLNFNPGTKPACGPRRNAASRGLVIPAVGLEDDMQGAVQAATRLDVSRTPPFRLVIAGRDQVAEVTSPGYGAPKSLRLLPLVEPLLFASSGLGDDLVDRPRRELMNRFFGEDRERWPRAQAEFHGHSWPKRPEVSVLMARAGARTVSRTAVTIRGDHMNMTYEAFDPEPGVSA